MFPKVDVARPSTGGLERSRERIPPCPPTSTSSLVRVQRVEIIMKPITGKATLNPTTPAHALEVCLLPPSLRSGPRLLWIEAVDPRRVILHASLQKRMLYYTARSIQRALPKYSQSKRLTR